MTHLNVGRITLGFFPYWIGLSWWRKVSNMRIIDVGYLKLVYWKRITDNK